jgi:hypothetical protein
MRAGALTPTLSHGERAQKQKTVTWVTVLLLSPQLLLTNR